MARSTANTLVAPVPSPRGPVLAAGRSAEVVAFDEQVVEFFARSADVLGVPKSVAAIYGVVFASPAPLSFADIEQRLDLSKGSISQGLRLLREVGAFKEVSTPADRAELFTPDLELRKLVARFLQQRLEKQLAEDCLKLAALSKAVPGTNGEAAERKKRIKSLTAWNSKARALLPVARTFLKLGT